MVDRSAEPRVLVLRCGACRTTLPAASHDVAFRCPQCGRGWEIAPSGLNEHPSLYVALPKSAAHRLLYLPYWKDVAHLTARDRAEQTQRAFVSAYSIHRPTYVGEWGQVFTRALPKWETRHGHGPDAPGAAISSGDARAIARHYVLADIDRAADLGSLEVDVQLGDPELWAIPCYDLGDKLRCPWTRSELPATALDDLSEIRHATERREA
jgi:hypothetical protein